MKFGEFSIQMWTQHKTYSLRSSLSPIIFFKGKQETTMTFQTTLIFSPAGAQTHTRLVNNC